MAQARTADQQEDHVERLDLNGPTGGRGASRVPEIALGVLLVTVFALAALWWQVSSTEKVSVLSLAVELERGEILEFDDLAVVQLNTDDAIAAIPINTAGLVLDQLALAPLAPGTILNTSMFAEVVQFEAGQVAVGVSLAPEEMPSLRVRPGDLVDVVLIAESSGTEDSSQGEVLATGVDVLDVAILQLGSSEDRLLTLVVPEAIAPDIVSASANDRIRLIQVALETS